MPRVRRGYKYFHHGAIEITDGRRDTKMRRQISKKKKKKKERKGDNGGKKGERSTGSKWSDRIKVVATLVAGGSD